MRSTSSAAVLAAVAALVVLPAVRLRARPAPPDATGIAPAVLPRERFDRPTWLAPSARLATAGRYVEAREALPAIDDVRMAERGRRLLFEGLLASRAGDFEGAREALIGFLDTGSRTHPLRALALQRMGEAALALEAPDAERWLADAVAAAPDEAGVRIAWAEALASDGRGAEASAVLVPLVAAAPGDPAALALAARLARDAADVAVALRLERRLFYEHPCSPGALALPSSLWAEEPARAASSGAGAEILARCARLAECGHGARAAAEIESVLESLPAELLDRAHFVAGSGWHAAGKHAKAVAHFASVGSADPLLATETARARSRAFRSLGRRSDAAEWLRRAAMGADCQTRDDAALALAADHAAGGRASEARELWSRVLAGGVTPSARARAGWSLAWSRYRAGDATRALADFDALIEAAPSTAEAATAHYWAARIVGDRGRADEAKERLTRLREQFPNDYHGLLASEQLGLEPELPMADPAATAESFGELLTTMAEHDAAAAARVREEALLGLVDDALLDLSALENDAREAGAAASADAAWHARVILIGHAGRPADALRAFRAAAPDWRRRRDVPPAVWAAAYPLVFDDLVIPECGERQVDPALVLGLIHQESVFQPAACSWVGARGLMQVMPGTGRTIARWFDESIVTEDLLDPELNVRYGTEYLKRLLDEFPEPELALAGYNAGGGRVRKWWRALPDKDVPLFVESIPFAETRNYVKAVRWNRALYRACYLQGAGPEGRPPVALSADAAPDGPHTGPH